MIDEALMDAPELDGLDGLVRRVDPDRWLSSRFIADPATREDVLAIYAFDHELARAPRIASNPLMGEIRLTWWREALDEIFQNRPVRHHPTAQALAEVVQRHGLAREPLEAMIDARYRELDATPMSENELLDWARDTGGLAAQIAAQILDPRSAGRGRGLGAGQAAC
jgi:phytoene synthase